MSKSAIYTGQVFHKRYTPREHTLAYRTFFLLLALDELPALQNVSSLFSWNRRAWFSFHETDFGSNRVSDRTTTFTSLQDELENLLSTHGISGSGWQFELLTMPRTLGYAFNPISLIYCRDANDVIRAMVYEVSNTFGERIHYVLPVDSADKNANLRIHQHCEKELFVSPFFDMQGQYYFDVGQPLHHLNFKIDYLVEHELKLRASFSGVREEFSAVNLRSLALKHSGTTYKVIMGIHWEAVKLWWKGLSLVNHVPLVVAEDDPTSVTSQSAKGNITYQSHNYSVDPVDRKSKNKKRS